MALIRLQKYLAEKGLGSRRACERMILEGKVAVDGSVAEVGQQIEPERQKITVNGMPLEQDEAEKVYIVLNKPAHVITTVKDTHGRRTVMDCLQGLDERVFPVGRLDQDVSGVLLFTNDGDLAYQLAHPKFLVHKTYHAWVKGHISEEALQWLREGVSLEDGFTAPAKASLLKNKKGVSLVELTIHEGRKREVKRMFKAVGYPVKKLHRTTFADIKATGLRPGEWRRLSDLEIKALRQCVAACSEKQ